LLKLHELDDEIAFNDKIASIFLIVVNGLFGLYSVVHQTVSTGFFTPIFLGGMLDGNDGMYTRKILKALDSTYIWVL